jgi:hypothetical protein
MERTTRDSLLALLVGGGLGTVGVYWGHTSLGVVTGLCWAGGLKLTLRVRQLSQTYATGETWADSRWTGAGIGLVSLAALVGVSPTLPISNELRLGLGLLVLGAGLGAYSAGTLAVLELLADNSAGTPSSGAPPQSTDGDRV